MQEEGAAEVILQKYFLTFSEMALRSWPERETTEGTGLSLPDTSSIDGISVKVFLLADPKVLRGDAETNYQIFLRMKGEVISIPSLTRNIRM